VTEQIKAGNNNPRYSRVPDWLLGAVSPRAYMCYGALSSFADYDTGKAWPGRKAIAKKMGCTLPTVDKALSELEEAGAIRIERRTTDSQAPESNVYWVFFYKNDQPLVAEGGSQENLARVAKKPLPGWPRKLEEGSQENLALTITNELEPMNETIELSLGERCPEDDEDDQEICLPLPTKLTVAFKKEMAIKYHMLRDFEASWSFVLNSAWIKSKPDKRAYMDAQLKEQLTRETRNGGQNGNSKPAREHLAHSGRGLDAFDGFG